MLLSETIKRLVASVYFRYKAVSKWVCLCFILSCAVISSAHASDWIQWQSSNLQLLKGHGYELSPGDDATIVTFEYANQWKYGDFFVFVDYAKFDEGGTTTYMEYTPRISLNKVMGRPTREGLIKDIFITGQIERGRGDLKRYLKGFGVDLGIEGFKFLKLNLLHRKNPDREDTTWQFYSAWNYPIHYGGSTITFEGFFDWVGDEGGATVSHQLFVPRLLWDISDSLALKKGTLHFGVEWQYWHNKFGVNGFTESVPQLQLKWVFL